jgi:alpha-glucosidase
MLNDKCFPSRTAWLFIPVLLGASVAKGQDASFQKTDRGIEIRVGGADVELAVATSKAFRLSISYQGKPAASASTFLAPETAATPWQVVHQDGLVGIADDAGKLLIDPQTGKWTLEDAKGTTVIPSSDLGKPATESGPKKTEVPGLDLPLAWKSDSPVQVYGCGSGTAMLEQTDVHTHLGNGVAVLPYYWSPNGYAVLAVTADDNAPAFWTGAEDQSSVTWHFPGTSADLYLMPAASLAAASKAEAQLTGYSPVPPRWTLGYIQSRYGWTDRAYVEDTLHQFRTLHIPLDGLIIDFEWYTPHTDYKVPAQGVADFPDFGWNPVLFPQPADQLAAYRKEGIHFVGIRKPRIANSATLQFLREKGWMRPIDPTAKPSFQQRDANWPNADFRAWYAQQSEPLLQTGGIGGWWNDEGEGSFTNYYYWNEAELEAWDKIQPNQRFWSLNRSFSPGLQHLGAAAWTGDIRARWDVFQQTPTDLLNWSLAGMSDCACDIGGFLPATTPELLSRWMEAGAFFPIMRAHSTKNVTAHFPWLFGPDAQAAMTKAINLRYRLIPYYYSLDYQTHETGLPLMRPLLMEFPDDAKVANLSDQWLMGSGLMAAPILQQGATARPVYLPAGRWFPFENGTPLEGDQTITATAQLDEIPVYVHAGTILPLAPVVQSTDNLPGGPLDLQIYPGKDATFTLVDDDGETTDYLKGAFRKTTFTWNDATRQLSWTTEGTYQGPRSFKEMTISLLEPSGKKKLTVPLDATGSVLLPST